MTKPLWLPIVALIAVPIALGQRDKLLPDAPLKVVGVCAVGSEGVSCWNPRGFREKDLTESVGRKLAAMRESMAFVPNRKNRFLLVEHLNFYRMSFKSNFGRTTSYSLFQGDLNQSLIRIDSPADAKEATLIAEVWKSSDCSGLIATSPGSKASIGGVQFEIGPVARRYPAPSSFLSMGMGTGAPRGLENFIQAGPSPSWRVIVGPSKPLSEDEIAQVEALDKNGKRIDFIDRAGQPLDESTVQKRREANRATVASGGQIAPDQVPIHIPPELFSMPESGRGSLSSAIYESSIDPKRVAHYRITLNRRFVLTIAPIPLDPLFE